MSQQSTSWEMEGSLCEMEHSCEAREWWRVAAQAGGQVNGRRMGVDGQHLVAAGAATIATVGLFYLVIEDPGQIADSRGLRRTSTLISLSSSFGFLGRLLPSVVDYFCDKNGYTISRTAAMASLMPPMAGAYFLLLSNSDAVLYASTAVIATCTGAISSAAVRATSELFGTKHFGVNHNLLVANIPVGNLCFGYLATFLYQRTAAGEQLPGRSTCSGVDCYGGAACLVGTLLCTVLHVRSRVKVHEMPAAAETGIQMGRKARRDGM